jgi:hypothetical protein
MLIESTWYLRDIEGRETVTSNVNDLRAPTPWKNIGMMALRSASNDVLRAEIKPMAIHQIE